MSNIPSLDLNDFLSNDKKRKDDFVIKLIKQADRDSVNFNIEIKENEN